MQLTHLHFFMRWLSRVSGNKLVFQPLGLSLSSGIRACFAGQGAHYFSEALIPDDPYCYNWQKQRTF
jgi:hypothetical protein